LLHKANGLREKVLIAPAQYVAQLNGANAGRDYMLCTIH